MAALQDEFKTKLGLSVYKPNPKGGNSNTGRTAKRAFENPAIFAEITGFPEDLIRDFDTLVTALACGEQVDPVAYKALADSWLDRFFANKDINWSILSPSVHMILVHGAYI